MCIFASSNCYQNKETRTQDVWLSTRAKPSPSWRGKPAQNSSYRDSNWRLPRPWSLTYQGTPRPRHQSSSYGWDHHHHYCFTKIIIAAPTLLIEIIIVPLLRSSLHHHHNIEVHVYVSMRAAPRTFTWSRLCNYVFNIFLTETEIMTASRLYVKLMLFTVGSYQSMLLQDWECYCRIIKVLFITSKSRL